MGEHLRYRVQYRKKGYGDGDWFGLWSRTNEATIRNLEAGTVYEFRVGGDCNPIQASQQLGDEGLAYSAIHEFTTPTEDEMAYYNCGIPPEIEIANQEPLLNLGVNEVFTAGDFPVTIKYVEYLGQDGRYSGWGIITIPYLGDTGIRVEFENIKINTDYQLVEGMVETSYDAEWSGIVDVDQAIEDIKMTLAQLVELLSNIGIDSATRENIKTLTEMMVQQAQEELPQPIAEKLQAATEKMNAAKEQYDLAIAGGNQELADQAKNDFKAAQSELKDAEKERDDFLKAYASIIKDALKKIVSESEDNLNNGLHQFGEESIVVTETGETLDLNAPGLDQLNNVLQPVAANTSEQDLLKHFEYERWQMLNYISTNLQTDEGTQELGNLLENEGEKLGIYIYNRLEENAKRSELIFEVKEILIETITEKIALSTKLF